MFRLLLPDCMAAMIAHGHVNSPRASNGNLGTFFHHKWEPHDLKKQKKRKKRNGNDSLLLALTTSIWFCFFFLLFCEEGGVGGGWVWVWLERPHKTSATVFSLLVSNTPRNDG